MIQVALFLLDAVTSFFSVLLLLRFLMQLQRVSFANAAGQFVLQTTSWLVLPLRRIIPALGGLDLASLLPVWLLQCLLVLAVVSTRAGVGGVDESTLALLVLWRGVLGTLRLIVWIFIGALLAQAVLSWVNPRSPIAGPLSALTRPVLQPIQRVLPPVANVDLSPLVAIVLLQALLLLL